MLTVLKVLLYLLITVLVLGVLTFIHELGHYTFARIFKVSINEFSIGMGPKLFAWKSKKNGIQYSLRAFPIGGFVSMVGEDEETDDPNALNKKKIWQRLIILAAGSVMNLIFGFLLTAIVVLGTKNLLSPTIHSFKENAVSATSGLMEKDKVLKVDGVRIFTGYELVYEVMNSGYEPIDIVVERNGEKITLNDVSFGTFTESGATFGDVDFMLYGERFTFGNVVKQTFFRSLSSIKMIWDSLKDLVFGRYTLEAVSGPVGMTEVIGEAATGGIFNLLFLTSVISMNLGVVNLLPIPAIDGSRVLFLIIEGIRRKPIKREAEIHAIGLFILLAIMVLISLKDIIGLFK